MNVQDRYDTFHKINRASYESTGPFRSPACLTMTFAIMFSSEYNRVQPSLILAVLCPFWFLVLYLTFAAGNPDFSHTINSISTLGALGQPHALGWNLLGFVTPGIMVSMLGMTLRRKFPDSLTGSLAGTMLVISGLLLSATGIVPADPAGEGSLLDSSHDLMAWGSFAAFLVTGALTPWVLWSRSHRNWMALVPMTLVVGTVLSYQFLMAHSWALGQRFGVACYFLWIGAVGFILALPQEESSEELPPGSQQGPPAGPDAENYADAGAGDVLLDCVRITTTGCRSGLPRVSRPANVSPVRGEHYTGNESVAKLIPQPCEVLGSARGGCAARLDLDGYHATTTPHFDDSIELMPTKLLAQVQPSNAG